MPGWPWGLSSPDTTHFPDALSRHPGSLYPRTFSLLPFRRDLLKPSFPGFSTLRPTLSIPAFLSAVYNRVSFSSSPLIFSRNTYGRDLKREMGARESKRSLHFDLFVIGRLMSLRFIFNYETHSPYLYPDTCSSFH